ncbi:hypothetical protein CCHOA_06585 [Corynebacterium choanae]|uniref:Uncharacterized protein n=1 Tax=Corynebacterium choanae TaxID=1862358 RepID=A0A3G6J6X1_9CORY|nr:hypothetical protein CCHOA_06585 [Corynebacterium choanae]
MAMASVFILRCIRADDIGIRSTLVETHPFLRIIRRFCCVLQALALSRPTPPQAAALADSVCSKVYPVRGSPRLTSVFLPQKPALPLLILADVTIR